MKTLTLPAEGLTLSQSRAIQFVDRPLLVLAGAGSGKTRVITYKVAHLIRSGLSPYSVLAITFTRKAASKMEERVLNLVGVD
jgi:DNA helicase-2/ATP-dependent DNA helicase PcrA